MWHPLAPTPKRLCVQAVVLSEPRPLELTRRTPQGQSPASHQVSRRRACLAHWNTAMRPSGYRCTRTRALYEEAVVGRAGLQSRRPSKPTQLSRSIVRSWCSHPMSGRAGPTKGTKAAPGSAGARRANASSNAARSRSSRYRFACCIVSMPCAARSLGNRSWWAASIRSHRPARFGRVGGNHLHAEQAPIVHPNCACRSRSTLPSVSGVNQECEPRSVYGLDGGSQPAMPSAMARKLNAVPCSSTKPIESCSKVASSTVMRRSQHRPGTH